MKKILAAHLHFFRNEAHYEFMIVFRNLLTKFQAVMAVVSNLYNAFLTLLMQEEALVNLMRKSDYTAQIAEADHRVDRTVTGMREVIASALHHFDPGVVAAAQSLYNRFAAFGDISKKSYEEETAAVNLLLADLANSDYAQKVATVGLTAWVSELQAAEADFEQLLGLRTVETADKPQGRLKEVRNEINKVYHRMIDRISAADTMDESGTYNQFINELNAEIAYFNDHYHHAKKDLGAGDHCVIEPIDVQQFTGRPITPVPVVHYLEEGKPTVRLSLGKDFSVTYKNNTNVGMAELTIHGKGAYKGTKSTTFNIAR
jgi:hypothetical protein